MESQGNMSLMNFSVFLCVDIFSLKYIISLSIFKKLVNIMNSFIFLFLMENVGKNN